MFLTKCCFRRGYLATVSLPSRRFLSSSKFDPSLLPRAVIEKAEHYIKSWAPHAIPGYFKATVLQENVPSSARVRTTEALLDLLLRKRYFLQASQILDAIRGQHGPLSGPLRAKILTVRFIGGSVTEETYFHNLEGLLRQMESAGQEAERHVIDILHLLAYPGSSPDHPERVANIYIGIRESDYQLHSSAIAVLIACHLAKGNKADADRWLDYHSKRPVPENAEADPVFCLPYTAYAQSQLIASPEKDPRDAYGPILDRMTRDRAWPDSYFMNVLITAELEHGHPRRAVKLYNILCSHISHGVYPDETTYAKLFEAAAKTTLIPKSDKPSKRKRSLFPKSRRLLFREMAEMQLLIKYGHLPLFTPVITKVSLGAALKMFITHEDYAAAILTLKVFDTLRIPLEQRLMDMVITSIVQRCQLSLASESPEKRAWADVFLNVREIPRGRVKGLTEWELRRRVISVARRALSIAQGDSTEDTEKSPDNQEATTAAVDEGSKSDSVLQSSQPNSTAVNEGVETDEESPDSSEERARPTSAVFRTEKKRKMREMRFRLIDVLISRAYETTIVLQGLTDPSPYALRVLKKAYKEMMPNEDEVMREYASHAKEENAGSVQDTESDHPT